MSKNKTYPRPAGHHVLTPMATVKGARNVVEFLESAFEGNVVEKFEAPNGQLVHAEVMVGDSVVMIGDASPEMPAMPIAAYFYVEDSKSVDAAYERALKAGATSKSEPADYDWGYRTACVADAGGNQWTVATVIKELGQGQM